MSPEAREVLDAFVKDSDAPEVMQALLDEFIRSTWQDIAVRMPKNFKDSEIPDEMQVPIEVLAASSAFFGFAVGVMDAQQVMSEVLTKLWRSP